MDIQISPQSDLAAFVAGRRFGNAMRVEGVISSAGEAVADVVLLLV